MDASILQHSMYLLLFLINVGPLDLG